MSTKIPLQRLANVVRENRYCEHFHLAVEVESALSHIIYILEIKFEL